MQPKVSKLVRKSLPSKRISFECGGKLLLIQALLLLLMRNMNLSSKLVMELMELYAQLLTSREIQKLRLKKFQMHSKI